MFRARTQALAGAALLFAACESHSSDTGSATTTGTMPAVPSFTLTDQTGHPFGSKDLAGHVWIANFIFTRCASICPRFTDQMGALAKEAEEKKIDVRFVSFSVDPNDTPARLADYAHDHHADWTFLAGNEDEIQATVVAGLKIVAQAPTGDADAPSILHGSHFVLVDKTGRIHGYYDSEDPARVAAILPDAAALAR